MKCLSLGQCVPYGHPNSSAPKPKAPARPRSQLTSREQEVLIAIAEYQARNRGLSPSIRELGEIIGLSSSSTIFTHIDNLRRKGFIDHVKGRPRELRLTNPPEVAEPPSDPLSVKLLRRWVEWSLSGRCSTQLLDLVHTTEAHIGSVTLDQPSPMFGEVAS